MSHHPVCTQYVHVLCFILSSSDLFFPAPEASPVFISATTVSTTNITVTWEPPPLNMTNGIIDSYQIRYGRYNGTTIFKDIDNITIEGNTTLEFNIGGLQEFIEYGFQVRAVTVFPGPYTGFAVNTTFQAGM